MRETVLIIDTSAAGRQEKEHALRQTLHYQPVAVADMAAAVAYIETSGKPAPDVILLDMDGNAVPILEIVRRLVVLCPNAPLIAMTSYADYNGNVDHLTRAGAYDCLCKPIPAGRLRMSIQHALTTQRMRAYITWLERKIAGHASIDDMIGNSHDFLEAKALAEQAAKSRMPVWLAGEDGVGKSFFARAIHGSGSRAGKPFLIVHCETLAAMPNAEQYALSKIREAEQGTLLFKEAGALPPALQQRLIEIFRSGRMPAPDGQSQVPCDVRLMFSVITPAKHPAESQAFRQKLAMLGQLLTITLPPLRERKGDIALLARHFLALHAASESKYVSSIGDQAVHWLQALYWPGNIGQLNRLIWRAVMACEGNTLDAADLQALQKERSVIVNGNAMLMDAQGNVRTLKNVQEEAIRFALQAAGGCMTRAARSLGIGRSTLYRKVSEFSIDSHISRENQTTRPAMKTSSAGAS